MKPLQIGVFYKKIYSNEELYYVDRIEIKTNKRLKRYNWNKPEQRRLDILKEQIYNPNAILLHKGGATVTPRCPILFYI